MDNQTQPLSPALIEEVLAHKPQAAAELVRQLQTPIFNLALRMLGSVADAEDATQEILLLVLEKLPGFRGESALSTWVYRLAVNRLIDEKRSMFATHPLSYEAYAQDIQAYQKESQREDKQILARELKYSCTNVMLQCLKPQDRCIFILGTMFKADSRQAAEILNLTPEAYRQRLSRIRRKMADFLTAYCGEYGSGTCRCANRLNYAIQSRRLNPQVLDYTSAKEIDPETTVSFKNAMEDIDGLASYFTFCRMYESPERTKQFFSSFLGSAALSFVKNA